jgi:hypothetical protein
MMAAPYLAGEKPSAKNTRQRESLDSSLLQFFGEVQALEMNQKSFRTAETRKNNP